jgi:hypothetical protein
MQFTGKPSMASYGLQTMDVLYESTFKWNADNSIVDSSVTEVATRYTSKNMVVLDIERWNVSTANDATNATNINRFLSVVRLFRAAAPNVKIGYYGLVPIRDYWNAIKTPSDPAYVNWQKSNDLLKPIADAVDFLLPSIYTFYDDQAGWIKYATANIKEAKRLAGTKPVYPFVWMYYHPSNKTLGGQLIPGDYWTKQLETVKTTADGVMLWGGWQTPWDNNAAWWKATLEFMKTVK